jgi:iron complex transport system substrate-binding protein
MKSHRYLKGFVLGILVCWLMSSCGDVSQSPQSDLPSTACQVIQHDVGETTLCSRPQRIAVLGPHMLDILLALGEQPTGFAEFSAENVGEPVTKIPVLGDRVTSRPVSLGLRNTPSLEAIVQLKPDLIIGEAFIRRFYDPLSKIAPTLLFAGSRKDEWQQGLQGVAKALGQEEKAKQIIESYQHKLAATRETLAPLVATHPKLLLAIAATLPQSFGVSDEHDFTGGIFDELGFQLVVPTTDKQLQYDLSLEVLPSLDPDIIVNLVSDHLRDDATTHIQQVWSKNAITRSMRATQSDRVYFVDYYLWGSNIRGPIAANLILDQLPALLLTP